jgi:formate hydrogenlyase subunit 4
MLPLLLVFIASLFFLGIIGRVRAITSGSKGIGIFQPIWDVLKQFSKSTIYGNNTSFIFQIAPSIYFASIICAILVLPFDNYEGLISFDGDFVFFAYILALGKFFMILSAMDVGSSFEGMGANREVLYSMLIEPAFFILMGSIAMLTDHNSFYDIFNKIHFDTSFSWVLAVLATYIIIQTAMVENSRMPFDDPKTHLELTMVHEVMILDNSGFDLGLIMYGNALKFGMYGLLISNFFHDLSNNVIGKLGIFFGVQILFAIIVGLLESFRARNSMRHNAQNIFILTSVAILIFFGVLILTDKFNFLVG